jgi:hypothetical protein
MFGGGASRDDGQQFGLGCVKAFQGVGPEVTGQ